MESKGTLISRLVRASLHNIPRISSKVPCHICPTSALEASAIIRSKKVGARATAPSLETTRISQF